MKRQLILFWNNDRESSSLLGKFALAVPFDKSKSFDEQRIFNYSDIVTLADNGAFASSFAVGGQAQKALSSVEYETAVEAAEEIAAEYIDDMEALTGAVLDAIEKTRVETVEYDNDGWQFLFNFAIDIKHFINAGYKLDDEFVAENDYVIATVARDSFDIVTFDDAVNATGDEK